MKLIITVGLYIANATSWCAACACESFRFFCFRIWNLLEEKRWFRFMRVSSCRPKHRSLRKRVSCGKNSRYFNMEAFLHPATSWGNYRYECANASVVSLFTRRRYDRNIKKEMAHDRMREMTETDHHDLSLRNCVIMPLSSIRRQGDRKSISRRWEGLCTNYVHGITRHMYTSQSMKFAWISTDFHVFRRFAFVCRLTLRFHVWIAWNESRSVVEKANTQACAPR